MDRAQVNLIKLAHLHEIKSPISEVYLYITHSRARTLSF